MQPIKFKFSTLVFVLISIGAVDSSWAQKIVFVEASSELDDGKPATFAYNSADGNPQTAWCSNASPKEERLVFTFDKPLKIDSFGILGARLKGTALNPDFSRVKSIVLFDGELERSIRFNDGTELQDVKLSPAPKTQQLVITIQKTYKGSLKNAPVCISEVSLKSGRHELAGATVKSSLRALIPPARKLLHTWIDVLDGTERTLAFNLDGTFHFSYEPLLDGKSFKVSGTWRRTSKHLILKTKGKTHRLKATLSSIDAKGQKIPSLLLAGDAPDPSMLHALRPYPVHSFEADEDDEDDIF